MTIKKSNKLYGYKNDFNKLVKLYRNNNFPIKILFSGKKGIGKTTFSYHLINYIFSINDNNNYDLLNNKINTLNKSFLMVEKQIHPNFFMIEMKPEKNNIEIQQIRKMINFINKSSFDNREKIVLIKNIEYLNQFSANALLKPIEEPNNKLIFILLLNNEKTCIDTIRSRCIEYRLKISNIHTETIVNNYFNKNIYINISNDFKNYYTSPSFYIKFIEFCSENNLDYINISIEYFLKYYLKNLIYKEANIINNDIKFYFELYFRNKINKFKNQKLIDLYNYFNKRFNNLNKYNLDKESFFIEFNSKVFNE